MGLEEGQIVDPPPPPEKFDIAAHLAEGLAEWRRDPVAAERRQRELICSEISVWEEKNGELDLRKGTPEAKTFREHFLRCWKRRYLQEGEIAMEGTDDHTRRSD